MSEIIKLLAEEDDKEILKKLFEKTLACNYEVLVENYFSVMLLEILDNDKSILKTAKNVYGISNY